MGATHPTPAENTDPLSARLEGLVPKDPGNNIDDRMAALLKDHQDMGARPTKEQANGDLYDVRLPLRAVGTDGSKTVIDKPKAATKKK